MYVRGLATITLPPATRPLPVMALFSWRESSMRNFFAKASMTCHPTLWRVRSYSAPGLPRPTINFMRAEGTTGRDLRRARLSFFDHETNQYRHRTSAALPVRRCRPAETSPSELVGDRLGLVLHDAAGIEADPVWLGARAR